MKDKNSKQIRIQISKKMRFEVFKRDSFTCQYCGSKAPNVVLNVDHINPVSKGGKNDMLNLVTSCFSCNSGKSDIPLSDDSTLKKQQAALEELALKREQIDMMIMWRNELQDHADYEVEMVARQWDDITGFSVTNDGRQLLKGLLKRFGFQIVQSAIDEATDKYLSFDDDGELSRESVYKAWHYISVISRGRSYPEHMQRIFYIRGICRNKFEKTDDQQCLDLLIQAHESGVEIDHLVHMTKQARSWNLWCFQIKNLINEA